MKSHHSSCTVGFGQRCLCWKGSSFKSGGTSQTLQFTIYNPAAPWSHVNTPSDLQSIFINNINHMKNPPKTLSHLHKIVLPEYLCIHWKVCIFLFADISAHFNNFSRRDCLEITESLVPGCSATHLTTRIGRGWTGRVWGNLQKCLKSPPGELLWNTQLNGWLFSQSIITVLFNKNQAPNPLSHLCRQAAAQSLKQPGNYGLKERKDTILILHHNCD